VAFGAHGEELVGQDALEAINLDRLHAALTSSDWGIDELWQEILEKDITGLFDNDFGEVLLNSLKASMSSIDFSNSDTSEIEKILSFYSNLAENWGVAEQGGGRQLIAGAMLGMPDSTSELLNPKSLMGLTLKNYLPLDEFEEADDGWTEDIQQELANSTTDSDETGKQLMAGVASGVQEGLPEATTSVSAAGEAIVDTLGTSMGVSSPSIYGIQDGKFLMLGSKEGIDEGKLEALKAAAEAGKAIIAEFDSELTKTPEGLELLKQALLEQVKNLAPELQDSYKGIIEKLTLQDIGI